MENKIGLTQRIKAANSFHEIDTLMKEGKGYRLATDGTRRRWHRVANNRARQLLKEEKVAQ